MSEVQTMAQPEATTHDPPTRAPFRAYLRWLTLLCFVLYLLPLALLRIPSFESWGGSDFGPALDFDFQTANMNADVVIFGDSAAVVGIDPSALSAKLGLKVIDLPNTAASLPILGDMSLRYYLEHNRPPRLLVFYFSPWNFNYTHQASEALFEAEEILWRHGSVAQIISFIKAHPRDALVYPLQFWRTNPDATALNVIRHQNHVKEVADSMGHFKLNLGPGPVPTPCTYPKPFTDIVPTDSVDHLVETFGRSAQGTLFYLAPLPACTNASLIVDRSYAHFSAAPPLTLPPSDFKNDGPFAHPLAFAVPEVTAQLQAAIEKALTPNDLVPQRSNKPSHPQTTTVKEPSSPPSLAISSSSSP